MTLKLTSIANAEEFDKERVVMRAITDIDLTHYAVFCCRAGVTGIVAGDIPKVYWFFDKKIKMNDLVVLYTKEGVQKEKVLDSGSTTHFFYWGLGASIWTPDMKAVVVNTPSWKVLPSQIAKSVGA